MLIDTHTHLNFNAYKTDSEEVIKRTLENDIWVINVGTQYNTSKKAIEVAQKHERGVYAAVGLHPIHLNAGLVKMKLDPAELPSTTHRAGQEKIVFNSREEEFDYEKYKELAKNEKVVAVGEIGLDYYWKPKTKRKLELFKEKQREVLLKQLNLAKELNLPVIFHCRMAHKDLIEILSENPEVKPQKAVAHGFVGNSEELQKYLDLGFYIGFNGIIFKTIEGIDFAANVRKTSLDKILIETDCPYLTPPLPVEALTKAEPFENQRNEPIYVKYVAEEIAKIKNLSLEEIAKITTENAKKLFKID
jgi:TatD DNase family protein